MRERTQQSRLPRFFIRMSKIQRDSEAFETMWLDPGHPTPYGSYQELYDDIRAFFYKHVEFRKDIIYDVMTCWTIATWRQDILKVFAYMFFLGPMNSGKTRAIECLLATCFRAILAPSMSISAVFRAIEKWGVTLLIDESQIYSKDDFAEMIAILNAGYRRGQKVFRTVPNAEGDFDIKGFKVYGPKALDAKAPPTETLFGRSFVVYMQKNRRKMPRDIDEKWATRIRSKLNYLHYKPENLTYSTEADLDTIPDNRLAELFSTILPFAPDRKVVDKLLAYAKELAGVAEEQDKATLEGMVARALFDVVDLREHGKLEIQTVADRFNEGFMDVKDRLSNRKISDVLVTLGFKRSRLRSGRAGILWDPQLVEELRQRYASESDEEDEEDEANRRTTPPQTGQFGSQSSQERKEKVSLQNTSSSSSSSPSWLEEKVTRDGKPQSMIRKKDEKDGNEGTKNDSRR